jgi:hypothetical protein
MPDDKTLEQRLRAFMVDYLAVCQKHGMAISTTQDGGQTIAAGGSNITIPQHRHVVALWPVWDYEAREYVSSNESERRRMARIHAKQEREERATFDRLRRKYGDASDLNPPL